MSSRRGATLAKPLTPRERDYLSLLNEGLSNPQIAERLTVALSTAKWTVRQVYAKLGAKNRKEAVLFAREIGLLADPTQLNKHQVRLPKQSTTFIGREIELEAVDKLIGSATNQLVTIVGAGGMGKTCLALAVAKRQIRRVASETNGIKSQHTPYFSDGIFFVPLAGLASAEDIVATVAQTVNFQFQIAGSANRSPRQLLLDYLRPKRLLLVMDNFEHLLDGVPFVADLLATAPHVHILATSRERLRLQQEQIFTIQGLSLVNQEGAKTVKIEGDRLSVAAQLFLQNARRIQHDFVLQAGDEQQLNRICQLMEGMPLGIELAASWVDVLPLLAIANEIEDNLDFLETDLRDIPVRHQSLRVLFDASWLRLKLVEQKVFAQLCIFRGGFTRKAARAVANISYRLLTRLTSKSLLQYDPISDRYQIHKLLRQYGSEKLVQELDEETAVNNRHCAYFCHALQKWESDLKGLRQRQALSEIEVESDNIRLAWNWAVEQRLWKQLEQAANGLGRFYIMRSRRHEGERIFGRTAEKINIALSETNKGLSETHHTLAKILVWQANYWLFLGEAKTVTRLLQQSLILLDSLSLPDLDILSVKAHIFLLMGLSAQMYDANLEAASQHLDKSLTLHQTVGDKWGTAWATQYLGLVQNLLGHRPKAKALLEESLASFQMLGDQLEAWWLLMFLSETAMNDGQIKEAEQYCHACLALSDKIGNSVGQAGLLNYLAWITLYKGDFIHANDYFQKGLVESQGTDYLYFIPELNIGQSLVKVHKGQYREARQQIQLAYRLTPKEKWSHSDAKHSFLADGMVALAMGEYSQSQQFLQGAVDVYQNHRQEHHLINASGVLSTALVKLDLFAEAQNHLHKTLRLAVDIRSFQIAFPLAGAALLLAELDHKERAVELYSLAQTVPLVANSRWFADVYGRFLTTATKTLPIAVIKAAQNRGRLLDLWETVEKTLRMLEEINR